MLFEPIDVFFVRVVVLVLVAEQRRGENFKLTEVVLLLFVFVVLLVVVVVFKVEIKHTHIVQNQRKD